DGRNWSKPENLGYPINTVGNDVSFSVTANGKRGYFASSRFGGEGEKDLYSITFTGPEKEGIINNEDNLIAELTNPIKEKVIEPKVPERKMQLTLLKGVISDAITLDVLEATIEIFDNEKNELIGTFESNSASGKYLVSLPSGKNYGISVKAKGYLFYSDNIVIPASGDYNVIRKDVALNKLDVGSKVVLKNIFFDTAKDSLRPESFSELGRLKKLLDDFPYLTIEISGHTDNVGGADYNKNLSERRANSVVNYLVEHDVNLARLTHVGYGFDQPMDTNDTPEGRQNNRRTEFKITGTDYKAPKEKKEKKGDS
ncbi:MAG: OmpA family protein, partial [Flavobacteriales bacterium]|nr:OmpA family protein [Flavobacteriales bacterium]